MGSFRSKAIWVIVVFTIFLFISAAYASMWKVCTINDVGVTSGASRARLTATDGSFTQVWFDLEGPKENQMLALMSTAMIAEKKVWIQIDGWTQFSPVHSCYMIDK